MSDRESIFAWIQGLPNQPRKRRRTATTHYQEQQLASPPASLKDDTYTKMTLTPKRRRLQGIAGHDSLPDPDTTPRPGIRRIASSSGSFSTSASETSSRASGTPSTKQQIMNLRLSESGVECKPLDVDAAPDAAQKLVSTLEEIGRAHDILPHALEHTIVAKLKERDMEYRKWRHSFLPMEEPDGLPGRIPTFEEVEKIHWKARECQEFNHEESSWNSQVHLRVLESIYEEAIGSQCDDFNAMSWYVIFDASRMVAPAFYAYTFLNSSSTARPHREFKPASSPIKMINICVYASVDRDAPLKASLNKFSGATPTQTVNHTDFEAISARPLLLSIETKRPGVHWDTAQLQIGIWHAAQWSFLRWAVRQKILRQRADRGLQMPQTDEEQDEFKAEELTVLSSLGFIPGIIIQGHRWHLVLSTYGDGKTKLWTDYQFGTTQSCLEIYAVIAGMRQLTAWARDSYLPWFKRSILD